MNEVLIRTTFRILCPMLALSSFFLFLRGHNLPGGGFIGGLTLSLSIILYFLANSQSQLELLLRTYFHKVISLCLIGIALVAIAPNFLGTPMLSGIWTKVPLPIAGKLSSILIFDFYIYLLVAVSTSRAYIEFADFSGKGRLE